MASKFATRVTVCFVLLILPLIAFAAITELDPIFAQLETQYQLPQGILAKTCQVESRCRSIPNADGGAAMGMFQFMPGTFTTMSVRVLGKYPCLGRSACGNVEERLDPVISARFTAIMYADARAAVGTLIQQARMDMITGLYLTHFFGIGNGRRFIQQYIQNPDAPAAQHFGNGARGTPSGSNPTVFYNHPRGNTCARQECTFAEIYNYTARKMGAAPVRTGISGDFTDPNGISRGISGYSPPEYFRATANTLPAIQPDQPRIFMPAVSPQDSSAVAPIQPQTGQPGQYNAARLIVQPKKASANDVILVSWTSVGMQSNSCMVQAGTTVVSQGQSEGSQKVTIPTAASGEILFSLMCTSRQGSVIASEAIVAVE